MKVFKRSINGVSALDVQPQMQEEVEHMERIRQGSVIVEAFTENGKPFYRIMPDLTRIATPKAEDKYKAMNHDDLVTSCVARGIPVKRDTLTSDLLAIASTADTDIDKAIAMAEQARPAIQNTGPKLSVKDYSGGVPMQFRTQNGTM